MVFPEEGTKHDRPVQHPWRAVALIAAGFVAGIVLVAKSHTVELSSSAISSATTATSTTSAPTTSGVSSTTTPLPAKPSKGVKVFVANGTSVSGAATRIGTELSTEGYTNETPIDTTSRQTSSAIYYAPGYQANAAAIATFLQMKQSPVPLPATLPVTSIPGADVLVVIGPDLASATTSSTTLATHPAA